MSEIDEFRAKKNDELTVRSLMNHVNAEIEGGRVKYMIVAMVKEDDDIDIGYSSGDLLAYMGVLDVAKNDLLSEYLEWLHSKRG